MNATAAMAALAATPSTEMFGLPECDAHLIAKLRRMDPALLASITPQQALADYANQRHGRGRRSRLPIPAPATTAWCRCPYCSPITAFAARHSPAHTPVLKSA